MRNEGLFLLEWVAYHLTLGFDQIFIVTNDCTDGTDRLAQELERLGHVTHVDNPLEEGVAPQISGMRKVLAMPGVKDLDWLLHIDADEFLNITSSDGSIQSLVEIAGEADAMALLWRPFGDSGLERWDGGRVLETFLWSQGRPRTTNAQHKTMFRPQSFGACIDHMPKAPVSDAVTVVNARGEMCPSRALHHPTKSRFNLSQELLTWENACINHYAIKSQDVFLLKNHRGDGMGRAGNKYHLNSTFYTRHNKNRRKEESILRNKAAVDEWLASFMANPVLHDLHQGALRAFRQLRGDVLTDEQIDAWTLDRSLAQEA